MKSLNWAITLITDLFKNQFTGNIQINFFKGEISNVNKAESFKPIE